MSDPERLEVALRAVEEYVGDILDPLAILSPQVLTPRRLADIKRALRVLLDRLLHEALTD